MRCQDFDALIEEMLQPHQANFRLGGDPAAGVLHADASQHMRQCERCNSYFRARSAVESGLRALAAAPVHGPSRATDRRVMEAYRRLRPHGDAGSPPKGRLLAFPRRGFVPAAGTRWGGMAVAVALLAIVGSGIHLWTGTPTVTAPSIASAPVASQSAPEAVEEAKVSDSNLLADENLSRRPSPRQLEAKLNRPARSVRQGFMTVAKTEAEGTEADAAAAPQSPAVNSIMRLASTAGAAPANGVSQSAGSTWPGYDNLMYCDPVVCSGPMQVVNIKVPASQLQPNPAKEGALQSPGKPSAAQADGNSFVNVEVLVGPDGVARAIRVAN
jgi:hypothetical protein